MKEKTDLTFELLIASSHSGLKSAAVMVRSCAFIGGIPVGDCERLTVFQNVPDSKVLLDALALAEGLKLVPENVRLRIYLPDKRLVNILYGPIEESRLYGLGEWLRVLLKNTIKKRTITVDVLGYHETKTLERLESTAKKAVLSRIPGFEFNESFFELKDGAVKPVAWFEPKSLLHRQNEMNQKRMF